MLHLLALFALEDLTYMFERALPSLPLQSKVP